MRKSDTIKSTRGCGLLRTRCVFECVISAKCPVRTFSIKVVLRTRASKRCRIFRIERPRVSMFHPHPIKCAPRFSFFCTDSVLVCISAGEIAVRARALLVDICTCFPRRCYSCCVETSFCCVRDGHIVKFARLCRRDTAGREFERGGAGNVPIVTNSKLFEIVTCLIVRNHRN